MALQRAIARGLESNLRDQWRFLEGERYGLELVLNKAGAGGPSRGFCRVRVESVEELMLQVRIASAWWPDAMYVRMNPSTKKIARVWHSIPRQGGTSGQDITDVHCQFFDIDPWKGVDATPEVSRRCYETVLRILDLFAGVLGQARVEQAAAHGFSGRGAFALVRSEPLPNTLETSTLVQEIYAGAVERCRDVSINVDDTATDPPRLVPLAGILKRKAGSAASFKRTGIVVPDVIDPLTLAELRTVHATIGRRCHVQFSDARPVASLYPTSAPSLISATNLQNLRAILTRLGFDASAPDCAICSHLQRAGQLHGRGGFRGAGVKWVANSLYCHHHSCRDARGGAHAQRAYDVICWTLVGKERELSLLEQARVNEWIRENTDAESLLVEMQRQWAAQQQLGGSVVP
ncbi:MAG TPA: hypothetical protein VFN67_34565 [Polyangiales bacterium]|nr:hypothetical protein [Polyangiales bacterium]